MRVKYIDPQAFVNRPVSKSSKSSSKRISPPSLRDRLLFVIWLAGRELGVENAKQFAEAIDKDPTQLSQWVREEKRPSWASIKKVADAVGVSPLWLDEPTREGAVEPEDFQRWLISRRKREADQDKRAGGER